MAVCLDRFAQGAPWPDDMPAEANCAECGLEIYEGQEVWVLDGKILCSDACLMEHIGAIRMTVEEALEP